ncbi:MAG: PaaI family thioesterase [Planctomycetota bacterium]|jgi:uncharacterized protein (TIGR00369 family)
MQYIGNINFSIVRRTDDEVESEMPIQPGVLNPLGTVHAGATVWFADVTATTLVLGGRDPSAGMTGFPLAINISANLAANQSEGKFRAVSRYVKRGRTVSIVRTTVTGADERLIADITTSHVASK